MRRRALADLPVFAHGVGDFWFVLLTVLVFGLIILIAKGMERL